MAEYITKEQALEAIKGKMWPGEIEAAIKAIPPADVAPVVHGKWVRFNDFVYVCSHCSGVMPAGFCMFQFCQHCGARMDGDQDA